MKALIIYIIIVLVICSLLELNCWWLDRERRLIMEGKKLPWCHRNK